MKKFLFLFPFLLFLGACNPEQIVRSEKYVVITPDEAMYTCPVLENFPEIKNLTDRQVAKLLVEAYKNNLTCKSSIEAIRKFLNEQKTKFEVVR